MPRHDYQCRGCDQIFERVVRWDEREIFCACGAMADRIYRRSAAMQDDTVPGGARWMHNLGDAPVWVETKSELRKIMADQGLVHAERAAYCKDDKSPWATRNCLRPGQRDPFVHPPGFNDGR